MNHKFVAVFLLAMVVFVAVHFVDFRGSVPDFRRASGGGTLLDMTPAFSEDGVYERLAGYGTEGRANYAFRLITVDVLLPLALLPFLFLWMRLALGRLSLGAAPRALWLAIPVLYVFFDLLENGSVLALLANYPGRMHSVSLVLPYVTVIKRAASLLAIFVPLAILGVTLIRTRWTQRHAAA
jgi:hypothetical protein